MYLVDTNILSAGAPTKAETALELIGWMDRNSDRLYVSVITIAEIEDGIAKSRRESAHRKARLLAQWLETVLHLYRERVVPIDVAVARHIGVLTDFARGRGRAPGLADVAIAATARQHGWTVLTRNLKHFGPLGVSAQDPFTALPPETR